MRVRVCPKVVGLVRGGGKHFEPIERKPAVHDTAKCGYIWTESGDEGRTCSEGGISNC